MSSQRETHEAGLRGFSTERRIRHEGQLSGARLVGCGLDAEEVARFDKHVDGRERPWRSVFTEAEVEHALGLARPALGLCAAFCCKEALLKALGEPFDYRGCQLELVPGEEEQRLVVSSDLLRRFGVDLVGARVLEGAAGECVVVVCLFQGAS